MSKFRVLAFLFILSLLMGTIPFVQARSGNSGAEPVAYLPLVMIRPCDVFFDDFSNPDSGWRVGDVEVEGVIVGHTAYNNDEYQVETLDNILFRPIAPAFPRDNYLVEADMRFQSLPADGLIGLVYGAKIDANDNVTDYYAAVILPDTQQYAVFRLERQGDGSYTVITIQAFADNSAINTGTAVNHMAVIRNGTDMTVSVNGTTLGTWSDDNITGTTYMGLALNPSMDTPVQDGRFDNFNVEVCLEDLFQADIQHAAPTVQINPTDNVTLFEE